MKFSIVTISFNQAEFLERAILSVCTQEGVELDYIIVDPGSTDGSREIIHRYRERFSHIILDGDKGPADGLNKGFSRASGDIYCYLNSDDSLEPAALIRAARFFEEHPGFHVICGHAWVTDRHDNRLRRVWSEPYGRYSVAYGAAVQIQPSTFIRSAAFKQVNGFNINNRSQWDGEMLCDLYLSGAKIGICNEFLSCYRLHGDSITNSGKLKAQNFAAAQRRFEKLTGRTYRWYDWFGAAAFRCIKHCGRPSRLLERLRFGPIYGRGEP